MPEEDEDISFADPAFQGPRAPSSSTDPFGSIDTLAALPDQDFMGADPISFQQPSSTGTSAFMTPPAMQEFEKAYRTEDIISGEESNQLIRSYPALNPEQRVEADRKLDKFFASQEHKEDAAKSQEIENMLLNPEAKRKFYQTDAAIDYAAQMRNPEELWARHVNTKILEEVILKRPLLPDEYEGAKNNRIGRDLAGKPKIGDSEALDILTKRTEVLVKNRETMNKASTALNTALAEEIVAGKPVDMGKIWDSARKGMPDLDDAAQTRLYSEMTEMAHQKRELMARNAVPFKAATDYYTSLDAGTATVEQRRATVAALAQVPKEDIDQILVAAADFVTEHDVDANGLMRILNQQWEVLWSGFGGKGVARGMAHSAIDLDLAMRMESLNNGDVRVDGEGNLIWFKMGVGKEEMEGHYKLNPEQQAEAYESLTEVQNFNYIRGRMQDIFDNKIKFEDVFQKDYAWGVPHAIVDTVFFNGQQAIGPMVAAAFGWPLYVATYGTQFYRDQINESPNMNKGVAVGVAGVATAVNYALDRLQVGIFLKGGLNPLKFVQSLLSGTVTKRTIARGAATVTGETAIESAQDILSDVGSRATKELILQIKPDIEVGQLLAFNEIMDRAWKNLPENAGAMFFLSAISVGAMTYKDVKDPEKTIYSYDNLKSLGLPEQTIAALKFEQDFEARERILHEEVAKLTPEQINDGILYAQGLAEKQKAALAQPGTASPEATPEETAAFVPPTLQVVTGKDGERRLNLLDENGNVVLENMTEEVANAEYSRLYQEKRDEFRAAQLAEVAAEDQAAEDAQIEEEWAMLSPAERTTAANVLRFSDVKAPTLEQQKKVALLRQALKNSNHSVLDPVIVSVDNTRTRAGLGALNFIGWFERTFGKSVVFVASESGEPLSFGGMVVSTDPNTIFLNASGNRNVLALLGHEYSHTLEKTNPALWQEMTTRMAPLFLDWVKSNARHGKGYAPDQMTPETIANVMGDAFADPEFWALVRDRHSGFFERMMQSVLDWFDTIIDAVSEWGTQAEIRDLKGMRNLIAQTLETAKREGPEVAPEAFEGMSEAEVAAAKPRAATLKPSSDAEITGALSAEKQGYVGAHRALPAGTPIGVRIDIPAYERTGTYVQTVHEKQAAGKVGKRIGYDSVVAVDNPVFWSNERGAMKIKEGAAKFPIATVEGAYNPSMQIPADLSKWTPVGFNPHKHSYFYDKNSMEMVTGGAQAISMGNTVWVKNPVYGDRATAQFAAPRETHKFNVRGERQVDDNGGYVKPEEEILLDAKIDEWLDSKKIPVGPARTKMADEARKAARASVMSFRARHPDKPTEKVTDPWASVELNGIEAKFIDAKEGEEPTTKVKPVWKEIRYSFETIPEGMTSEEWSTELATRVMKQFIERLQKGLRKGATAEERKGAELILREIEWYRDFTKKLRTEYGGFADLMADFLGSFSPMQNVRQNVRQAIDAIWAMSSGKYDKLFEDINDYLAEDPSHTIDSWRAQGGATLMTRSNKLFGQNTSLGMLAALNMWREIKFGDAPKAKNFTRNLIALSIKATIDVWAARLLNRVAGRLRVPSEAEGGVQGAHLTISEFAKREDRRHLEEIPVKGQFAFGQEVFAKVAAMMQDPKTFAGVEEITPEIIAMFAEATPADVQAMNWFVEKEVWTEKDWTNDEGAGGSFMLEISNLLTTRFQVGMAQAVGGRPGYEDFNPQDEDQARFAREVHDDLARRMPEVIALRVMDSLGMFKQFREKSLDTELVHGPGMEPNDLIRTVLYHAWSKDQENAHISRIIDNPDEEAGENARPGIEIMFEGEVGEEQLKPVMALLNRRRISGFTAVVDPRAKAGRYRGIRFQYVPEYSGDGPEWAKNAQRVKTTLLKAIDKIYELPGVSSADVIWYDTLVFTKGEHYDDSGINPGAVGTVEARAWRRRYYDSVSEKAARSDERQVLPPIEEQHIPDREREQASEGTRGPPEVGVTVFDHSLNRFAETPQPATKDLAKRLREEAKMYGKILKCLQ